MTLNDFKAIEGDRKLGIRTLPVLAHEGSKEQVAKVLLAVPHSAYWKPYRVLGENAFYFSLVILLLAGLFGIAYDIRAMEKPVIMAVNGVAAGAGANLALAAHLVIAARSATSISSSGQRRSGRSEPKRRIASA